MRRFMTGCLVMAAFVPVGLHAQVTLGARTGMNISTVADVDLEGEVERLTGLRVEGTATFALVERVGLQFGVAWSPKGASLPIEGTDTRADLRLGYIDFPVLLKVGLATSDNVGAHLLAGGTFSYNHACRLESTAQGSEASFDCEEQGIEPASFDYGASLGAGLSVALGDTGARLVADGIFTLGLADLVVDDDARNRVLSLLAGIQIPIG